MSEHKRCVICNHPDRVLIESAITTAPYSTIAQQYGFKIDQIKAHVRYKHTADQITKAKDIHRDLVGEKLATLEASKQIEVLEQTKSIQEMAQEIYTLAVEAAQDAKKNKSFGAVGQCLSPAVKVLEIISNVSNPNTPANNGTWEETRLAIIRAVDNAPEAKEAIITALEQRRRSTICPEPGNMGEGSSRLSSRSLAAGSIEIQSEEDTSKLF